MVIVSTVICWFAELPGMGAIGALSTAAGALRRNPVIVLGVLALSIVGSLTTVGQGIGPS